MADFSQGFLASSVRWTDENGNLTIEARTFLQSLWERTGGGAGGDLDAVAAEAASAQADANAAQSGANASLKIAQNLNDVASKADSRLNLGLGTVATGNTQAGWSMPTGTGSRASFNMDFTETATTLYSQAQLQNIIDQLIAVQKRLGATIIDSAAAKVLGP